MRADSPVRVIVATPVFEYHKGCIDEYMSALTSQTIQAFDILLVDNSPTEDYANYLRRLKMPVIRVPFSPMMRDRTVRSRNLIREVVLRGVYSHLLFLDQDVILPPDGLERLLKHQLSVVTGIYLKDVEDVSYAMVVLDKPNREPGEILVTPYFDLPTEDLFEVAGAGFGCLLITREVCEQISFRYEEKRGGDICFSADVKQAGYRMYCDSTLICPHRYITRDFTQNPTWGYW